MSIYHILRDKNYKKLNSQQSKGVSLVSDGEGGINWSSGVSALQKDVYLNKDPILLDWSTEFTEFQLPLHADGSFQFISENQICHIRFCLFYRFVDAVSHLPFYIQVKKNDEEVYLNSFGHYDKAEELNKISDYLSVDANKGDIIKFFIRKKFNDVGQIDIQPLSYITYEVL